VTTQIRKPPSYRLHKVSGQTLVQFRGRRYYLGKYGSPESRQRYQRFISEVWTRPVAPAPTKCPRAVAGCRLAQSLHA
jgi:hypothetical protein